MNVFFKKNFLYILLLVLFFFLCVRVFLVMQIRWQTSEIYMLETRKTQLMAGFNYLLTQVDEANIIRLKDNAKRFEMIHLNNE